MNKFEWAMRQLMRYEMTVCFREKVISHPNLTASWYWGVGDVTFRDAVQQVVDTMRASSTDSE